MVSVSLRQNRPEPVERNPHAYPHPDNPGLIERPGGYYDWAGRRLFLPSGEPDPATPGAYRYQTRPDLCDLEAPDSDPASPRYEPPHLRHQPGDTWEIGGKPHDPEDPGPYGTPGWYQDRRTGRHRRNELPDPIPPWETDEHDQVEPVPSHQAEPDRPSPSPHRRYWNDTDEPHRFSRLREDAWDRWLIDSEPLAEAHHHTGTAKGGPLATALLRAFGWIVALLTGARATEHESARPVAPEPTADPHRAPADPPLPRPLPGPRTGNGYIGSWETAFDARHAVVGGGLA
ncbi:hypothetical protein [Glycomyces arizonensis]|uniref:hypothetical protein n=1 Tax=Glycomyces arizonensis TaxID=256035 RepID=UPI000409E6A7|nr:hypothetical protein [Glycomyces arizonensis]